MKTLPKAFLIHEIDRRMRLRVPSKRGNRSYFSAVQKQLKSCAGVDQVRVNPSTGSILVLHAHPDSKSLADYSRRNKLFTLSRQVGPARPSWSVELAGQIDAFDAFLRSSSNGRWDVATIAGIAVLGLSARQVLEGNYLPPAWTLLAQAARLFYVGGENRLGGEVVPLKPLSPRSSEPLRARARLPR